MCPETKYSGIPLPGTKLFRRKRARCYLLKVLQKQNPLFEKKMIANSQIDVAELLDWWRAARTLDRKQWLTVVILAYLAGQVERTNYNNLLEQKIVAKQYFPADGSFSAPDATGRKYNVVAANAVVPARSDRVYVEIGSADGTHWAGPHPTAFLKEDLIHGVDSSKGSGVYVGDDLYVWFPFDYLGAARSVAMSVGFSADINLSKTSPNFQAELIDFIGPYLR